jgi:hypothetical protein
VFGVHADLALAGDPVAAGSSGRTPFQLLNDTLEELVATASSP